MRRALGLVLCLWGCAGSAPPSVDAGAPVDAGFDAGPRDGGPRDAGPHDAGPPRPPDAGPQLVDAGPPCTAVIPPPGPLQLPRGTGPVLAHPQLVTLAYPGADDDGAMLAYADAMMQSRWLAEVGADYGVGTGTHARVALPPLDDAGLQTYVTIGEVGALVSSLLADGGLPTWPDGGVDGFVYLVLYPPGVSPADLVGGEHGEFSDQDGGRDLIVGFVVYSIWGPETPEEHNDVLAHELIEAATDPRYFTAPAFQVQPGGLLGSFNQTENADLCQGSGEAVVDGQSYPRIWSNSAAAARQDPCVPHTDTPWMTVFGPGDAVLAAPGTDVIIPLTGFTSDPSVTDWPITVTERGGAPIYLADHIDADQTIAMRVTVPNPLYAPLEITVISNEFGANPTSWPVIVRSCRE